MERSENETNIHHTCKVEFKTDRECKEMELLSGENLARFGMKEGDIINVRPIFDIPGYLYQEAGIARIAHPCAGSACVSFQDQYGYSYSVDCIAYHDSNPNRSHFNGEPHWNIETRFMKGGVPFGEVSKIHPHTIKDSPVLEIETNCDGECYAQKVLRDQPVKGLHKIRTDD